MKRLFIFAFVFSTSLFAANGSYFIGVSPNSKGMGGTGVGNFTNGTDAMIKNTALLSELPGEKGKVGVEVITSIAKENVWATNNNVGFTGVSGGEQTSKSGAEIVPTVSGTYKLSDQFGMGLSAMIYGGAKADFMDT